MKTSQNKKTKTNSLVEIWQLLIVEKPKILYLDTETTGLDLIKDKPFLVTLGWAERIFAVSTDNFLVPQLELLQKILFFETLETIWIWNAKFDCHMLTNLGLSQLPWTKIKDGIAIVALTNPVDTGYVRLGLKEVAGLYDQEADALQQKVKKQLNNLILTHKRKMFFYKGYSYTKVEKFLRNIDHDFTDLPLKVRRNWIDYHRVRSPNYADIDRDLMVEYAKKDIALMRDYIQKRWVLIETFQQQQILALENACLEPFFHQERVGVKIDKNYVMAAVTKLKQEIRDHRQKLYQILGEKINVNQHIKLRALINQKYNIDLEKCDIWTIKQVLSNHARGDLRFLAQIILYLRSLEKWYTTYGVRILTNLDNNDFLRANFNLFGTITGRVSSNFHQFPNKILKDLNEQEIFNPRQMLIPYHASHPYIIYFDYSEMEMRLQAEYTIQYHHPDKTLIAAYLPWDQDRDTWIPLDVHMKTTQLLFGTESPKLRKFGKAINFTFIYGGGISAIYRYLTTNSQIKSPSYLEVTNFFMSYQQTYSGVVAYQKAVQKQLILYRYVKNLFGRRYYLKYPRKNIYKAYNYLIQGSAAYLLKIKVKEIYDWLKKNQYQSFIFLTIHDEILLSLAKNEQKIIPKIKEILETTNFTIPIKVNVEATKKNWAQKQRLIL